MTNENQAQNRRKRKKKWIPLVVLVGIVVLLAVLYAALSAANDKKAAEEAAREAAANLEEKIAEYDAAEAVAVSYTNKNGTVSFTKEGDTWQWTEDAHFPVNQELAANVAEAMSTISVTRSIDEGEAADYGLAEPAYTLSIRYSNDVAREYKIGDRNSFNGEYYLMTGSRIYMVSSDFPSHFDAALDSFLVRDSFPTDIETDYITAISITGLDGEERVVKPAEGEEESDGLKDCFNLVRQLNFTTVADYYSDDMAGEYGIDGTSGVKISYRRAVTVSDGSEASGGSGSTTRIDTSYSILFGQKAEDGSVYYTPQGSAMVYTMPEGLYEQLTAADNAE